jgi:hypothetical protein
MTLQGCQYYTDGQGQEVVRLTDDVADALDKGAEVAPVVIDTLTGVAVAFPVAAPIIGILVGAITAFFGAYKKFKPQITREHTNVVQAENMTRALVFAIEKFKESNTEDWEILKLSIREQLADKVGPEALAVIDTLLDEYKTNKLFEPIK